MGKDVATNPSQAKCFDGGAQAYDDDAVEVRTGVTLSRLAAPVPSNEEACKDPSKHVSSDTDGITIRIKCSKSPHLVQFIYREIIGADGKPVKTSITGPAGEYNTTTKPNAFYEVKGQKRDDADSLTTFDQPSVHAEPGETWRATFKAYAICDGKVIREITWVRERTGSAHSTYKASVTKVSEMPDWAKEKMKEQGYDNP